MLSTSLQSLPNEVMTMIFRGCLPDKMTVYKPHAHFHFRWEPIPFTLVCRHWRALILSTPSLWATLHLTLAWYTRRRDIHQIRNALAVWSKNSGRLPTTLSLYILSYDMQESRLQDIWSSFSPGLDDYIVRCKQLEVKIHPSCLDLPEQFRIQLATAKNLQDLEIHAGKCGTQTEWVTQAAGLLGRLRTFKCNNHDVLDASTLIQNLSFANVSATMPNYNLRALEIRTVDFNTLPILLTHFPNVEVASFTLNPASELPDEDGAVRAMDLIHLGKLRALSLHIGFGKEVMDGSHIAALEPFQRMLLPALQNLSISVESSSLRIPTLDAMLHGLAMCLRRSDAPVVSMDLKLDHWSDEYGALFESMPSLKELALHIDKCKYLHKFLSTLRETRRVRMDASNPHAEKEVLCPRLQIISLSLVKLKYCFPQNILEQLSKFVRTRWVGKEIEHVERDSPGRQEIYLEHGLEPSPTISTLDASENIVVPKHQHAAAARKHLRRLIIRECEKNRTLSQAVLKNAILKRIIEEGFSFEAKLY